MKLSYIIILINFSWILQSIRPSSAVNVIALLNDVTVAISESLHIGYQNLKCPFGDCCNDYWIPGDLEKLNRLLNNEVFGQHIATDIVSKQIKAHLGHKFPAKPLVLSFHGWTGNGKNHVAYIIAKSLYHNGIQSKFYHHFMATAHFPHASQTARYQDELRNWVKGNVSECAHSLFVFDEVDKMPEGVLDGIRAYLDYVETVDRVDFRKSIFIFLSNTGGREIAKKVHEVWLSGQQARNSLTVRDFERLIETGTFNEKGGGLYHSGLINKSLIDVYVPFLPMEKKHVRLCVENEFKKHNYTPKDKETAISTIVDGFVYFPEDVKLYSITGCKRISQRVGLYIANEHSSNEFDNDKKEEL